MRLGVDVDNDPHLVTSAINFKLHSTIGKDTPRKKFDVNKLKDSKARSGLTIALRNRFDVL